MHTHALTRSVRLQFGRCSVRHFYPAALEVLMHNQELFKSFIEYKVGFSQAEEVSVQPHDSTVDNHPRRCSTILSSNKARYPKLYSFQVSNDAGDQET